MIIFEIFNQFKGKSVPLPNSKKYALLD